MTLLSTPQRPLNVVGRLGRKKQRARGARWEGGREKRDSRLFPLPIVPPRAFYFSVIAIFIGMSSGSLCGGERDDTVLLRNNIHPLLIQREVMLTGYWPSSFLRFYQERHGVEDNNNAKRTRPISSRLDWTSLVDKRFVNIGLKRKLFLWEKHEQARCARLANQNKGFASSYTLVDSVIS